MESERSRFPWLLAFGPGATRISHLGIGLNDACRTDTGWTIIDEHRAGAVFLALGENRYMGGATASSLNHDMVLRRACFDAGAVPLVVDGRLAV